MLFEFRGRKSAKASYWQTGIPGHSFSWEEGAQAISLLFLGYLRWFLQGNTEQFWFIGTAKGSPAATLGDAFYQSKHSFHDLFVDHSDPNSPQKCFTLIVGGMNLGGKSKNPNQPRSVTISSDLLPADCVDVHWDAIGPDALTRVEDVQELEQKILKYFGVVDETIPQSDSPSPAVKTSYGAKSWGQVAPPQNDIPIAPSTPPPPTKPPPLPQTPIPAPSFTSLPPTAHTLSLPESVVNSLDKLAGAFVQIASKRSKPERKDSPPRHPPRQEEEVFSEPDSQTEEFSFEAKPLTGPEQTPTQALDDELADELPPAKIDPLLLQIQNPYELEWSDSDALIDVGSQDGDADVWKIRDACEGLLIFGAVGSGKTSGSGSAFARVYLQSGFGGLVLTAKSDEAKRWLRMCEETGRANDYVHVTPQSGHMLNFLQYEIQRPGVRIGIADDLIVIFRRIIDVARYTQGNTRGDEFWTNTTNQLMRKIIELFLLAGEPLTLNRMMSFMTSAPQSEKTDWRNLKGFCSILSQAKENATKGTDTDRRIYRDCFKYWTVEYPKVPDITRGGFITGFSAMADTLSGRGIYEMICTGTNLTPEMILSGKIVILDIPLKGNIQGGLMVQAIWKLLFQQAVERRADKGLPTARPAFLWEDEGHEFFSEHDVRFQPTARDIRAPHVIISQNLHNFLHLGHNKDAVMAVFAAMNTYIFHTNGDLDTNKWASERIGRIKKLKLTTDGLLKPLKSADISWFEREPDEVKNVGKITLKEETKSALEPEDFMRLKRGGDGTCEAVILWLSHQFAGNHNRNFCVLTFEQEQRLK